MSLPPDFIHELKQRFAGGVHLNAASRVLYSADASIYQIEPLGVAIPRTQDDPPTTFERTQLPCVRTQTLSGSGVRDNNLCGMLAKRRFRVYNHSAAREASRNQTYPSLRGRALFPAKQSPRRPGDCFGTPALPKDIRTMWYGLSRTAPGRTPSQ